ncbi:MAG: triose-phosphate isomerase [Hyphomicrobiales bacterium]
MRKKIVAGNWKMNKTFQEAEDLLDELVDLLENVKLEKKEVVVCPPTLFIELAFDYTDEVPLRIGAQNINDNEFGAYTGEISAAMLHSMGVEYAIIGHSERRKYYNEDDALLAKKVDMALDCGISPIFCIGEQLEDRESGKHFDVVRSQIENALFHLKAEEIGNVVFAYEPVWAIGTGKTATPDQAQEMHEFIRKIIAEKYSEELADIMSILYGGSCNAKNAEEIFSKKDVDGGLIGGASLKADDFVKIIESL